MALYQIRVNGQVIAERKRIDLAAQFFHKLGAHDKELVLAESTTDFYGPNGTVLAYEKAGVLFVRRPRGYGYAIGDGVRGLPSPVLVQMADDDKDLCQFLEDLGLR